MSYAQFDTIEATDYNNLVGGNPVTSSGKLNTVWGTGGSNAGYGQSPVGNVTVGDAVYAANWADLIAKTSNAALHQGTSITSVTAPVVGGKITYNAAISNNLTTVYTNRLNASSQGTSTSNAVVRNSTWTSTLTFTHTIAFANGDAARYFFNSGGQLVIKCTHPYQSSGVNRAWYGISDDLGNIYLSSPTSGTCRIAGVNYNGVTQRDFESEEPAVLSPNTGYYALSTGNTTIATQFSNDIPSPWVNQSYIRIIAKSNGTQGSNGDNGSIITLYTTWNTIPSGGNIISTGSNTTCTIKFPETTYISNTWGAVSITGTVAGT